GGLHEQRKPRVALELPVVRRGLVAGHGVRDVGGEVEGRSAGRPVAGALLAADGPPREGGTVEAELLGPLASQVERRVAPAERVAGRVWRGVRQYGEHEPLRVRERVAVVPGTRQPLRRDRALLRPRAGLQRVEDREAHGLLELGVALELHVGAAPELVEIRALPVEKALPTGVARLRERGDDLISDRRERTLARPAVG